MSPSMFARSAALGLLASSVSAAFNPASSSNVVVYWGQGSAQIPLSDVCSDENVDIVNIAFVNGFPRAIGDYPATNFANACGDSYYAYPNGTKSGLLNNCPGIEPGINICKANNKKVLLSIGGGWPTDYYLASPEIAEYFADFLWGAFGPVTKEWTDAGKPRPFGSASVDGFDLDIESFLLVPPFPDYQYANYDKFVNRLKDVHFGSGEYYISGAPQCVIPDVRLSDAISKSHFDFIFTQFYNTPECSARAGYNGLNSPVTTFTFDAWADWLKTNSKNKAVKLYMGLPAGTDGAPNDKPSYLTPTEANKLVSFYKNKQSSIFGGVMLWEATVGVRNTICSKGYASWIKSIVTGKFTTEDCTVSSSSSSVSSTSSSSSSVASSTSATITSSATVPLGTGATSSSLPNATLSDPPANSTISSSTNATASATATGPNNGTVSATATSSGILGTGVSSTIIGTGVSSTIVGTGVSSTISGTGPAGTDISGTATASTFSSLSAPWGNTTFSPSSSKTPDPTSSTGTSTPCTTSAGVTSTPGSGGYGPGGGYYSPSSTGPAGGNGPATTTVYTTTYVDICPTGFTTITTVITKTECHACAKPTPPPGGSPNGPPPGWTTTVTVCGHCGPKTTTVTLTKPIPPPTGVPTPPGNNNPPPVQLPPPAVSTPASNPPPVQLPPPVVSVPASAGCGGPGCPPATITSKVYVTLSVVPVPATFTPGPYGSANGTGAYVPKGSASATAVAGCGGAGCPPVQYTGAASRVMGSGMAGVALMVAGALLL